MFYNNINVKTTDICQLLPLCIKKTANINKNFIREIHIDDVQSIYITTNKSITSKEEAERIINSTKAIKYFQDFKTLLLNNELDLFFDDYSGEDILGTYYLYQNSQFENFASLLSSDSIVYSTIENTYHKNTQVLDVNIPVDLFDNILIQYDTLSYDAENNFINDYFSHDEIINMLNDTVNKGLKTALQMFLQNDGSLLPSNNKCELQALLLMMLKVPSIPVKLSILDNSMYNSTRNIFRPHKQINKQRIQELIQPNFILP